MLSRRVRSYASSPLRRTASPEFATLDPDGATPRLSFHRVPEPKSVKNRLRVDRRTYKATISIDILSTEAISP
ncbi:hypothetical protein ACWDA7_25115 [Streptomyces sp. NPDC001156]